MRNKKNFFTFLLTSLLCVSCFAGSLFVSGYNAFADEDENSTIVVSDDFSIAGGTGITNSHAFAYDHVTSDEAGGGHDTYGLIPASVWGANVDAGNGYVIYKIAAEGDNNVLSNLQLKFNCYFGCSSIGEYWGENFTNLRVYYSKNNSSWTEAFNLHNGSSSTVPLSNVVTDANGQSDISNGNTNVFGNKSVYAEYTADLTSVIGNSPVMYIKFEFIHLTYDDMAGKVSETRLGEYDYDTVNKKVPLHRIGLRLNNLTISYKQKELSDEGLVVYNDSKTFDYGIYSSGSDAWKETAYEAGGLSIREGVDYANGALITPALAPVSTQSEGYIVYKFKAPDGRNFSSANLTSFARCFDYNCQGVYEKLEYYISSNNIDFTLVHSSPIKQSPSSGITTELDLENYVFGKTAFYLKIVIGCSNDTSWTNLKELSVNVEFEKLDLTVDFGNGHVETVRHYRGETFVPSNITLPDGFVLDENVAYLSQDYSSDNVLSSTAPVLEETKIYLKGTWGCYSLNFVLDGGACDDLPDRYFSSEGLTLPTPVKEGSIFVGWFTDDNYSEPITEIAKNRTGGLTLYAKWVANNPPTNIVPDDVVTGGGCNGSIDSVLTVGLTVTLLGFTLATKKLLKGKKEERR